MCGQSWCSLQTSSELAESIGVAQKILFAPVLDRAGVDNLQVEPSAASGKGKEVGGEVRRNGEYRSRGLAGVPKRLGTNLGADAGGEGQEAERLCQSIRRQCAQRG